MLIESGTFHARREVNGKEVASKGFSHACKAPRLERATMARAAAAAALELSLHRPMSRSRRDDNNNATRNKFADTKQRVHVENACTLLPHARALMQVLWR